MQMIPENWPEVDAMHQKRVWLLAVIAAGYVGTLAFADRGTVALLLVAPIVALLLASPLSRAFGEVIGNSLALLIGTISSLHASDYVAHTGFEQSWRVIAGAVTSLVALSMRRAFRERLERQRSPRRHPNHDS